MYSVLGPPFYTSGGFIPLNPTAYAIVHDFVRWHQRRFDVMYRICARPLPV